MKQLNKYIRYEDVKKPTRSYAQYLGMLTRCSNRKSLREDYRGNTLDPDWLNYDNWMDWAKDQQGFGLAEKNGRLWSLDKDILCKGNKHYSPEYCCFVPNQLNQFFKLQGSSRGEYLLGASPQTNMVTFRCRINNGEGKHIYLGQFDSQMEAHEAYLIGKTNLGKELALKYENLVDSRVLEVVSDFKKWYQS